jgi:lysophospholipase L1-like esterase
VAHSQDTVLIPALARGVLLVAAVLLHGTAAPASSNPTVRPEARDDAVWVERFNDINQRLRQGNVDILFVGDSITHAWEGTIKLSNGETRLAKGQSVWDDYYAPRNAVNAGIARDQTQHLLWRLEHGNVDGINPRLVVVLIGTNNSETNTALEIADGIVAVVEKLQQKLPDSNVLLLAIFPRGLKPDSLREKLAQASRVAAERLADMGQVRFLDIGAQFLDPSGAPKPGLMPDGLHLSESGYRVWAEAMEPTIGEMLGDGGPHPK